MRSAATKITWAQKFKAILDNTEQKPFFYFKKVGFLFLLGLVVYTCNPSTLETETGLWIPGQFSLETLSQSVGGGLGEE